MLTILCLDRALTLRGMKRVAMTAFAPISPACSSIRSNACSRVFSQRLVYKSDVAADERLEAGADRAEDVPRPHDNPARHAQIFNDFIVI